MRAAVVFVPLLLLAGCSGADTSALEEKLDEQGREIAKLQSEVEALKSEGAKLRRETTIVDEQAKANQVVLLKHAELHGEFTKSIELHAGSLQRKTEIDKATAGTLTAVSKRLDVVEDKATGNRSLISEITKTLQELLK